MGTRNLTCVVLDGEYKVAQYGQWDGYPQGAGKSILNFLKQIDFESFRTHITQQRFLTEEECEQANEEMSKYRKGLSKDDQVRVREEDEEQMRRPTPELYEKYLARPFVHLNRDLGCKILDFVMRYKEPLQNDIEFAGSSLFCEWAYVIDLDKDQFEVYRGFNKEPVPQGERFSTFPGDREYFPVKLLAIFQLNQLPSEEEFLEHCCTAS